MQQTAYTLILVLMTTLCARADDLPTRLNFERYNGMLDHSPFAVASAVVAPAATPNFAKDLYVANAAKSQDGDMVTIASSADKEFKKYLTTANPVDGYAIANIEWSDRVGETKVTISKDGQFATLTFNQAVLTQPLPNRPTQPAATAASFSEARAKSCSGGADAARARHHSTKSATHSTASNSAARSRAVAACRVVGPVRTCGWQKGP
jgi:hypothetical protein